MMKWISHHPLPLRHGGGDDDGDYGDNDDDSVGRAALCVVVYILHQNDDVG